MRFLTLAMLLMVPLGAARGEGAVQVLDCTATTACNAAGLCRDDARQVTFALTPIAVDADGAGQFTIAYDAVTADMGSLSRTGPFVWSEGLQDTQTLLVSGASALIWVRQDRSAPDATTLFLTCEGPA